MGERISIQKEELIPRELESLVSLKGYKCVILHTDKQYVSYIDNVIHIIREIMGNYFEVETLSDAIKPQESIREKILNLLKDCVLGIVILDGLRPNVILEYGALLALGKPVIVLRDENAEIDIKNLDDSLKGISNPKLDIDKHLSDVKDSWCPPYDWRNPEELRERLENDLKRLKDDILAEVGESFSTREIDRLDINNYKRFQDEFIKLAEYVISFTPPEYEQIKVIDENIHHLANESKVRLSSKYYFELGNIYEKLAKHEEAIGSYDKAIEIDPDNTDAWNNKGTILGELGRHDEALKCFDKILEIDPNCAYAWSNKGIALGKLGRYDEALECHDKAIEINPNYAGAWNGKGTVLEELGRYDEALKCFSKAVRIDQNNANAWYNKGIVLKNSGRYDEALKCYDKAIEVDPDNIYVWNNRGTVLGRLGRHEEALSSFSRAIEIDSNYAHVWSNKGATLKELGRYDEALECFDKVLEIDSDNFSAWYNKACAYSLKKDKQNMLKNLVKAVKLNSNFKEMAKRDEDFKNFWDDEGFKKIVS